MRASRFSLPLRVQVMLLFAALIVSVGVVLASWDYRQIRAASILQADAFFARGAGAIERELRDEAAFAETDLRILRTVEIVINREAWAQVPFGPPLRNGRSANRP